MTTLHIHKRLESNTLPELSPLIGKTVDITVREAVSPHVTPGTGDWSTWLTAANALDGYDFDAWKRQREVDLQHANDHLP